MAFNVGDRVVWKTHQIEYVGTVANTKFISFGMVSITLDNGPSGLSPDYLYLTLVDELTLLS